MGEGEQVGICGTTMHLSVIKWIEGWTDTRTRVRLVATAGTYPRLFVLFFFSIFSICFSLRAPIYLCFFRAFRGRALTVFLFCSCLLSLLSVFSSHTGSSAICLLVSQFSCLRFANVVFFSAFFSFLYIDGPTDDRDGHLAGRGRC